MDLLISRSWWTGPNDLEALIQQTLDGRFKGIEGPTPKEAQKRQYFKKLLRDNGLFFIAEATTGCDIESSSDWWIPRPNRSIADHLSDLKEAVEMSAEMDALFVSTMCGYDAWSWQQNVDFFGQALELEKSSGVLISFETHRGRSLYNPWVTRDLLNLYPAMKITCDFSHWCVVCERLIQTEWPILELCAERAQHIQCRVGYAQHAQVADPRAPEYQVALEAHEQWWNLVWQKQRLRDFQQTTMTPEFLYDGYMQNLPYSKMPVADVWEITCWMADRQRQHFLQHQNQE